MYTLNNNNTLPAPPHNDAVARISADVLKMGFMKRTMVRVERHKQVQVQQETKAQMEAGKLEVQPPRHYPTVEHIDDDPNITLGGVMTEWRYTALIDNLRFGRFSFKGQNPEVEKLMLFHERRRLGVADNDEEDDLDDDDESDREEGQISGEDDDENEHAEPAPKRSRIGCEGGMEEMARQRGKDWRGGGRGQGRRRGGGRGQHQQQISDRKNNNNNRWGQINGSDQKSDRDQQKKGTWRGGGGQKRATRPWNNKGRKRGHRGRGF